MNGPNFETIEEAKEAQKEMAKKVLLDDCFNKPIEVIGGMDVSNTPFDPKQMIFGAMIACSYPSLSILQNATQANKQTFPYVSGLLGFREAPTLIQAYSQLSVVPDVIMVDGHGVSHPRGLGIASHLGVLLDIPTIGVAKSILVGTPAGSLSEEVGSMTPLLWKGKEIAMMVRTKKRCSPLIISAGHKISLKTAIQLVMNCLKKHRLPEPTRYAHLAANKTRLDFSIKARETIE
jgi:deoxyribonuclease V